MGENQGGCACAQGKDLLQKLRNVEDLGTCFRLLVKGLSVHNVFVSVRQAREFGASESPDGNLM